MMCARYLKKYFAYLMKSSVHMMKCAAHLVKFWSTRELRGTLFQFYYNNELMRV